jgi:hypothetical protein
MYSDEISRTMPKRCGRSGFSVLAVLILLATSLPMQAAGPPFPNQSSIDIAPIPQGVFSLGPGGKPINDNILSNPYVAGVTIRGSWRSVEKSEGQYEWSYFDAEIARVSASGRKVLLRITSGGENTPGWVFSAGITTFTYIDSNSYHATYGKPVTIPVPWDPIFLQKKKNFIAAMGQHFSTNPAVMLVSASCANGHSDDWGLPDTVQDVTNWKAGGYTSEKLVAACDGVIAATMAAFPNQRVLMGLGANQHNLDPDPSFVARALVANARAAFPGRFIAQKNSLAASTPDPTKTAKLGAWQIIMDNQPQVAAQMLWFVAGDSTCRMSAQVTPCDPKAVLEDAVRTGAAYGTQYQEIYEKDILNTQLISVIQLAADLLTKPIVAITAPANGQTLNGASTISVGATDAVGVTKVDLMRNTTLLATLSVPPYEYTWDTRTVPDGTYELSATAYDNSGNSTRSAPLNISVSNVPPPTTVTLSYNGKLRDKVGQSNLATTADGARDGTFTLTLGPGSGTRTVTALDLRRTGGGVWDTLPSSPYWTLGVAGSLGGTLLNPADTVNALLVTGGSLTLFAGDLNNSLFVTGSAFTLTVTFSDGTTTMATTMVSGTAAPATVTLSYNGKLRDNVGQNNLATSADGALDGTFTLTLGPGSGTRTVTALDLRRTGGGVWDTLPSSAYWTLGVAGSLGGTLLNPADTVNALLVTGGSMTLFVGDLNNSLFVTGSTFRLTVTFSDGTTATATATT